MVSLTTFPVVGSVSDGKIHVDVTRISVYGVYVCDAISRFFLAKKSKSEDSDLEDISDGESLFQLVETLSVCLRPLVHPAYYQTLRRYLYYNTLI